MGSPQVGLVLPIWPIQYVPYMHVLFSRITVYYTIWYLYIIIYLYLYLSVFMCIYIYIHMCKCIHLRHPPVLNFGLLAKSTKCQPLKIRKTPLAVFLSTKSVLGRSSLSHIQVVGPRRIIRRGKIRIFWPLEGFRWGGVGWGGVLTCWRPRPWYYVDKTCRGNLEDVFDATLMTWGGVGWGGVLTFWRPRPWYYVDKTCRGNLEDVLAATLMTWGGVGGCINVLTTTSLILRRQDMSR